MCSINTNTLMPTEGRTQGKGLKSNADEMEVGKKHWKKFQSWFIHTFLKVLGKQFVKTRHGKRFLRSKNCTIIIRNWSIGTVHCSAVLLWILVINSIVLTIFVCNLFQLPVVRSYMKCFYTGPKLLNFSLLWLNSSDKDIRLP